MKWVFLFLCALALGCAETCTSAQTFPWVSTATAAQARAITTDNQGNSFVTGYFTGATTSIGQTTLTNTGNTAFFIAKLDSTGASVWAKTANANAAVGNSIALDTFGNALVVGQFGGTANFGQTTLTATTSNYWDAFIAKFDSNGNAVWARSAGGALSDYAYSTAVDSSGNCIVVGEFYSTNMTVGGTTLTNTSLGPAERTDCFVVKYSSAGDLVWAKRFGGTEDDRLDGVSVDASSNVLLAGRFSSPTISWGAATLTNAGNGVAQAAADVLVAKLDSSGEVVWAARAGGRGADGVSADDVAFGVAADTNGNAYVSGFFNANASFGTNTVSTSISSSTLFLAKYDPMGNEAWVRSGGVFGGEPKVAVDVVGSPHVALYFAGTFVHGSTTLTNIDGNGFDILVAKYLPDGSPAWAVKAGGTGDDRLSAVAVDRLGNAVLAGYFTGTNITFGMMTLTNSRPSTIGNPLADLLVAKVAPPISLTGEVVGADFRLGIYGAAGRSCRILASTNLNVWSDLSSFVGQAFKDEFTQTNAISGIRQFFRVVTP